MEGCQVLVEPRTCISPSHPVGFVHILGFPSGDYLEQISVSSTMVSRGLGRALVEAAKPESDTPGGKLITLRTSSGSPWNAPLKASCGFPLRSRHRNPPRTVHAPAEARAHVRPTNPNGFWSEPLTTPIDDPRTDQPIGARPWSQPATSVTLKSATRESHRVGFLLPTMRRIPRTF